jgi:hypothetical protein
MILILDKPLSSKEILTLNSYCSVYKIEVKDDYEKKIKSLPIVDLYVVEIQRCGWFGRSYGLRWLETNYDCKMEKVYYRRTKMISKKNLSRLNCHVIKSLPTTAGSKQDFLDRLKHDAMPHTEGGLFFCLKYIGNKIIKLKNCIGFVAVV